MAKRLTARSIEVIEERILKIIGRRALRKAKPLIPSKTLADAIEFEIVSLAEGEARLHIPHFWAVTVHDGRGRVKPTDSTFLVWFQNPKDDPRTDGGRNYPVRREDVKHLTRAQYLQGLRENSKRRAAGLEPFMIVARTSGPVSAKPFFAEGMIGLSGEVADKVYAAFDKWVRERVPSETRPAVLKIR